MKYPPQPSGLQRGLPLLIDSDWTPEQAQAVFEVLDDRRERICEHYALPLQELSRQQRMPDKTDPPRLADPDAPFRGRHHPIRQGRFAALSGGATSHPKKHTQERRFFTAN